jgi:Domain of unknown function (DUF6285)
MQPRPDAPELAAAIREFLETEIIPTLTDPRLKFRTLVAMNALGMLEREGQLEEGFLRDEYSSLAALLELPVETPDSLEVLRKVVLELNTRLANRIRAENVPAGALETLKRAAENKLRVASPNYLKRYA